jgi:hypothetical protein
MIIAKNLLNHSWHSFPRQITPYFEGDIHFGLFFWIQYCHIKYPVLSHLPAFHIQAAGIVPGDPGDCGLHRAGRCAGIRGAGGDHVRL